MQENYLKSVKDQFAYYKQLGEKTFTQLDDQDLFWRPDPAGNSIAVIVNHLWGNMLSRWTDFLTSDGEKEWRQRDLEFEEVIKTREELMEKWEEGWACVFNALDSVNKENFDTKVFIRNEPHTIVEAVNRQLAHYASHVGQILFIGKMALGENWKSPTIPKGGSKSFNQTMFSKGKD